MGSFNACPMAIDLLILLCLLPLACHQKRLHPLLWMQGHRSPLRSCTERLTGADFTITLRKLHLDKHFACILNLCPSRTAPALWTGHRLGFPIDAEVSQVMA